MVKKRQNPISTYFPISAPAENTLLQRVAQSDGFLYIQIFGGNSPLHLEQSRETKRALTQQLTKRPITHLAEMDICWVDDPSGNSLLYSYHPSRKKYLHPLSHEEVLEKIKQGCCYFVHDLLEYGGDLNFFFDLKTGIGPAPKALTILLGMLGEKAQDCLFYSYDPLLLAELSQINPNLAMSVRTMKQWRNGRSVLVPRVSAAGSLINVYELPVGAITVNAQLHRYDHLRILNDHVRQQNKYLIFGALGRSRRKFKLAYDVGLGANMNKLSYGDVKDFL